MCKYRHLCTRNAVSVSPAGSWILLSLRWISCTFLAHILCLDGPHRLPASDAAQQPPTLHDGRTVPLWVTSLYQTGWFLVGEEQLWLCLVSVLCTHVSVWVLCRVTDCFLIFKQQEHKARLMAQLESLRGWCDRWHVNDLRKSLSVWDVMPQRLSLGLPASSSLIADRR